MQGQSSSLDLAVTRAEALFTSFLVEHNIALSASDHAAKLFRQMFVVPGINPKDIIDKYACARMKTTTFVQELAESDRSELIDICKKQPFSISTDGSNDNVDKLYPLAITYSTNELEVIRLIRSCGDSHVAIKNWLWVSHCYSRFEMSSAKPSLPFCGGTSEMDSGNYS